MRRIHSLLIPALALALGACGDSPSNGGAPAEPALSFFVTSIGTGAIGGDLGGLAGADETCQSLAAAVGAEDLTWHAYLSTSEEDARDRIGSGPWYNVRLQEIAPDVETLHEEGIPRLPWGGTGDEGFVIDENGDLVPLGEHDIITGSTMEGTFFEGRTCLDWTSASDDDIAQVGHSDLTPASVPIDFGGPDRLSWNSAHTTTGCTEEGLEKLRGSGRFYCFAINL